MKRLGLGWEWSERPIFGVDIFWAGAMKAVREVLFWVAAGGSVTSSIYCGMVLAAAVRFGLRKRREQSAAADFLPAVSVLKPLHGTEPGMERNLETFFEQDYREFELLFCARFEDDAGLQLARSVGQRYPHVAAKYVTCGEPMPKFHNAKVYSLAKLDSVAKNDLYVTSDADVRVERDYLRRMVQTLKDPRVGLASCVYLGTAEGARQAPGLHPGDQVQLPGGPGFHPSDQVRSPGAPEFHPSDQVQSPGAPGFHPSDQVRSPGAPGFAARLDAVGKSVEMTSGVLVADMVEGTKFALGATMATRRKSFQDVGGFNELGQFYADDFVLGNRLAAQGTPVLLATYIIRLMVQDSPFWLSFRNQLRWMQSTRRSRPWGHLGSGLTFAMPFGVLGLLWGLVSGHPALGLLWLGGMVVNRWLQAWAILTVLGDPDRVFSTLIYPLRDVLGSVLWVASYGGENFYYRGKIYKLKEGGRVESPE